MSFMSKFFQGGNTVQPVKPLLSKLSSSSSSSASSIAPEMHYSLCHWRTHTDIRPSCNIILVHDWLSTNSSWSTLIGAMQRLPQPQTEQELMLQQPLSLFCPDLPNHGRSPQMVVDGGNNNKDLSSSPLEAYAGAVLEFAQRVVPSGPIHIVGFGLGGTQIALLATAALNPERFGSFCSILGGEQQPSKSSMKPLILDEASLDAQDLSKSVGDLSSLNQVDDFLAKLNSAKGMSDVMRYNTGTAHCGATKWIESQNLKGTPSLQALSTKVRWNSNVAVLREMEDYGAKIDKGLIPMFEKNASENNNSTSAEYYKKELSSRACVILDKHERHDSSVDLVRSVFGNNFSALQVPNVTFDGLAAGARGPTSEDAEHLVVPFLSLYQDHKDYAQMMRQAQQAGM